MKVVQITLPLADAARIMSTCMLTTDKHYSEANKFGSEEHKNTIHAEQNFYKQMFSQVSVKDIKQIHKELIPEEKEMINRIFV